MRSHPKKTNEFAIIALTTAVLLLFVNLPSRAAEAMAKSKDHYITKNDFKSYSEEKYSDLCRDPQKYAKYTAVVVELKFCGKMSSIDPFESAFPEKTYYHMRVPSVWSDGEIDYDRCESSYSMNMLPIIISKNKRKKITDAVPKLSEGTMIKVFGTVKKIPKKVERGKDYYFNVEDIYTFAEFEGRGSENAEDKKGDPAQSKTPDAGGPDAVSNDKDSEDGAPVDIDPKNLDLVAEKQIGKKIRLKIKYSGRKGYVSLSQSFPSNAYFELNNYPSISMNYFHIIVPKTDSNIELFSNLSDNDEITVSGKLERSDKSGSPTYFMLVEEVKGD